MMDREKNFAYFKETYPEIYRSYENFGKELHESGGPLDEKSRWLIKVAVSAASSHEYSLRTHVKKALKAGCSRSEIEHALLLTATTAGFPTMMTALMILRDELQYL